MKLSKFKFKDTKKDNKALVVMGVFLFIFIIIIGTAFMVGDILIGKMFTRKK